MVKEKKEKTKLQKSLSIASAVIMTILTICVIFVLINLFSNSVPNFFGYSFLTVKTDSMEDVIPTGSVIMVKRINKTEVENLQVGEIVVYQATIQGYNTTITHRIIENHYSEGYINTKGDNNPIADKEDIAVDRVIAVYVKTMPVLSFIMRILSSTVGFILLIILPALVLIVLQVVSVISATQKLKIEKIALDSEEARLNQIKEEAIKEYLENNLHNESEENKETITPTIKNEDSSSANEIITETETENNIDTASENKTDNTCEKIENSNAEHDKAK